MTEWDPYALAALHHRAEALRDHHVISWIEQTTQQMWRPNAARYEPSELSDTTRGIATMAMENLRERLLADYRSADSPWRQRGVRVTVPQGSLLIQAAATNVHLVKARGVHVHDPTWSEFAWDSSITRSAAAASNTAVYRPAASQPDDQLAIPLHHHTDDAQASQLLREVFLVWGGDTAGRTAGWIGFPCTDKQRWLAVEALWRDDDMDTSADLNASGRALDGPSFSARPAPEAVVALKRREDRAGQ